MPRGCQPGLHGGAGGGVVVKKRNKVNESLPKERVAKEVLLSGGSQVAVNAVSCSDLGIR